MSDDMRVLPDATLKSHAKRTIVLLFTQSPPRLIMRLQTRRMQRQARVPLRAVDYGGGLPGPY